MFNAAWNDLARDRRMTDVMMVNNGSRYFLMNWSGPGHNIVVELHEDLACMKYDDAYAYLTIMLDLVLAGGE